MTHIRFVPRQGQTRPTHPIRPQVTVFTNRTTQTVKLDQAA